MLNNDHHEICQQLEIALQSVFQRQEKEEEKAQETKGVSVTNHAVELPLCVPEALCSSSIPKDSSDSFAPKTQSPTFATSSFSDLLEPKAPLEPFCSVNNIAPGGPADLAGLKDGDLLIQLGSVDHSNHRKLLALRDVVMRNANKALQVVVLRSPDHSILSLTLIPKKWSEETSLIG